VDWSELGCSPKGNRRSFDCASLKMTSLGICRLIHGKCASYCLISIPEFPDVYAHALKQHRNGSCRPAPVIGRLLLLRLLLSMCLRARAEKGFCIVRIERIELHRLLTSVGKGDVDTTVLRQVNGGEVAHDLRSLLIR
jgi:hypothetical protein